METPILAMIPSGYKAGKLYSILPSDGSGDFTVLVDADATRINKEGLIEGVALNQARLTYDPLNPDCPSLLLEPIVTNFLNYSEDFTQSNWNKSGVTITSNATTSPSGTNNGSLMTATATNGSLFDFNEWITTTRTASIFVKKNTSSLIKIINGSTGANITFDLDIGEVTTSSATFEGSITSLANNWYRINAQHNTTSGTAALGIRIPTSGQSVYIWGAQMEDTIYATSYVPTTSTQVTRTFDVCKDAGNAALFNISEGTFFVDVTPFKESNFQRITLSDGTTNNEIIFLFRDDNSTVRTISETSGVGQFDNTQSITFDTRNKLALTFKNNEFKLYINGILKITQTIGTVSLGLNVLNFAGNNGAFSFFEGEVHDTRVYDRVLTEAEAIKLTT